MVKTKAVPVRRIIPEACSPRANPHFIGTKKHTRDSDQIIARSTLTKVIREILAEQRGRGEVRVQHKAVEVLASAAEGFLDEIFTYAHAFLNHRNGRCFTTRDFRLATEVVTRDMTDFTVPWEEHALDRKHIHERHAAQLAEIQHYVQNAHKRVISVPQYDGFKFGKGEEEDEK